MASPFQTTICTGFRMGLQRYSQFVSIANLRKLRSI
jgi:hypothetical protein